MALADHVAILLHHSLDRATPNPKNKAKIEYFALIALPPAAAPAVGEMIAKIYPGIPVGNVEFNCKTNAQQAKPYPGVPNDWYILRLSTRFAPELYDAAAQMVPNETARSKFYAGMAVRVNGGAWPRTGGNGPAASFNLYGVMDAGQGGARLSLGSGATGAAFANHANPAAAQQNGTGGAGSAFAAHATPAQQFMNAFGAGQTAPAVQSAFAGAGTAQNATASAQPAGQSPAGAQGGNPFQQSNAGAAAQGVNPFA